MNLSEISAELNDQVRRNAAELASIRWSDQTSYLPISSRTALLDTIRNYRFVKECHLSNKFGRDFGIVYKTRAGAFSEMKPERQQIAKVYLWEILANENSSENTSRFPWDATKTRRILQIVTPNEV